MSSKVHFHDKYPMPDQQIHNGIYFPGFPVTNSREGLEKIRDFEVREDDIVLLSYPKTGSRWSAEMVSWICSDGDEEKISTTSNSERVMHLEANIPANNSIVLTNLPLTTQRIFSSHLNRDFAPRDLEKKASRIIIVIRNPKDNAVSYYHFYRSMKFLGSYQGTWDDFLRGYMDGDLAMGSYLDWLKSWWPIKHQENVMILHYEDSKKFPTKTVNEIARFLDKTLSEERVNMIVEKTSFSTMKNSATTNFSKDPKFSTLYSSDVKNTSEFIRKGVIGDWKSYFTVNQSEEFDKLIEEQFAGMELNFEYQY